MDMGRNTRYLLCGGGVVKGRGAALLPDSRPQEPLSAAPGVTKNSFITIKGWRGSQGEGEGGEALLSTLTRDLEALVGGSVGDKECDQRCIGLSDYNEGVARIPGMFKTPSEFVTVFI